MSPDLYKSVQERVREKITKDFINTIPPEAWASMVKAQMDQFLDKDFPALVKKELETFFVDQIRQEMKKPEWMERWTGNGQKASPVMVEVLKQAAPELVAAMFGNFAQNLVSAIRNGQVQLHGY